MAAEFPSVVISTIYSTTQIPYYTYLSSYGTSSLYPQLTYSELVISIATPVALNAGITTSTISSTSATSVTSSNAGAALTTAGRSATSARSTTSAAQTTVYSSYGSYSPPSVNPAALALGLGVGLGILFSVLAVFGCVVYRRRRRRNRARKKASLSGEKSLLGTAASSEDGLRREYRNELSAEAGGAAVPELSAEDGRQFEKAELHGAHISELEAPLSYAELEGKSAAGELSATSEFSDSSLWTKK